MSAIVIVVVLERGAWAELHVWAEPINRSHVIKILARFSKSRSK